MIDNRKQTKSCICGGGEIPLQDNINTTSAQDKSTTRRKANTIK